MSAPIPTQEPVSARAGDTWRWTRDLSDYPAPTWALTYVLYSSTALFSIAATASGSTHSVDVPPATTAAYPAGRYDWVAHVSNGIDRFQVGTGVITVLANMAQTAAAATLGTGAVGLNNALTWTAATAGTAGNGLSVTLIDPGTAGASLAAYVSSGSAIRVSLATNGAADITTTAAQLAAAVAASATVSALVSVANTAGSNGTGIVAAVEKTALSGGLDAYASFDGRSHARKMLDGINAILEGRATTGDLDVVRVGLGDRQTEWDVPSLMKLRQQYAAAVAAEDAAAALARGEGSGRMIQVRFTG